MPDELVFRDENNSASKPGGKRPAFDTFVENVKAGRVEIVFVRETSRLYRKPRELEDLLDLVEGSGFTVVPLFSSQQQLDGALERNDVFMARILVAKDAEESKTISKRVRMAKAKDRAEGKLNGGGRRPYGYRRVGHASDEDRRDRRLFLQLRHRARTPSGKRKRTRRTRRTRSWTLCYRCR